VPLKPMTEARSWAGVVMWRFGIERKGKENKNRPQSAHSEAGLGF